MDSDAYGRARKGPGNQPRIVPPALDETADSGPVPGQVVVRLHRGGPSIATASVDFINSLPTFGDPSTGIAQARTTTGEPDLDAALSAIGATALWRIHGDDRVGAASVDEGAELPTELTDLIVVDFDPQRSTQEVIDRLSQAGSVAEVTPSGGFSIAVAPNDPGFPQQWGMVDVHAPEAWTLTTGDPTVVVAVVDTGCDLTHQDLAGQFVDPGINTVDPNGSAQDDHGHGTHVAGIIAAIGDNGVDVAGVAWKTRVLPVKVLNSGGRSVGASIAQGIAWAADRCDVINLSLQGSVDDLTVRTAIDSARRLGVVVVAAMGNFGWGESRPSYPAAYARSHDNVLAVGAIDDQHRRSVWGGPTSASNTGSWIGIAAPGTNIDSLRRGGGVTTMSGTSQACPHVAGAAALVLATAPAATPQEVIQALVGSAQPLRDAAQDPVPNAVYGFGLVDVEAAVRAAGAIVAGAGGQVAGHAAGGRPADGAAAAAAGRRPADGTAAAAAGGSGLRALADRNLLDHLLETRPELLAQLLEDPGAVLSELGMGEATLRCPDVAHAALDRGQRVSDAANALDDTTLTAAIPRLHAVVENGFGAKSHASRIPFGIRFAEEVRAGSGLALTGTASVECTFGLGCRPDVDR